MLKVFGGSEICNKTETLRASALISRCAHQSPRRGAEDQKTPHHCCKSYPGSRAQIFLQGGRSQREAAARCLDSESKILVQAGVSEELRHGLCALSAVVSLLNSYNRLPSNGARKKSCTPSFEEGKCLLPQLNPRKKMEIIPGFKMQGVTEKGGAPFHTRVPELTQMPKRIRCSPFFKNLYGIHANPGKNRECTARYNISSSPLDRVVLALPFAIK
ncbi:uncharacterized protein LOC123609897 [Leopardus geoffroyi]|uniref:uncharacterized protein LOC123609897 n=1 Tax=Leopardus geoffroyi TaxID=46844 RepID=UPI001E26568D|nr:uncharacterized protein LOC123609897 [Leopardus geoffroyi]